MKSVLLFAVPDGVFTVIGPVVAPDGTIATIWDVDVMMNVALTPLNLTAVAPPKVVPLIVIKAPTGPDSGEKLLILGLTRKLEPLEPEPEGVVTVRNPETAFLGTFAVISASEATVRAGDRIRELGWLTGMITDLVATGRWDEAQARAEEAMAAPELPSLEWAVSQVIDLLPVLIHRRLIGQARDHLRAIRVQDTESPDTRLIYDLGRIRLIRAEGNAAEALVIGDQVLAGVAHHGLTHPGVKRVIVEAVEAAFDLGDGPKAEELLGIVQGARPGQVTPFLRAHAARLAARLAAYRDDADSVEPGFLAAEQGFRDLGTPFDLAVSLLEHAEWLTGGRRPDEAAPLLAEAGEIFARLRATPWIERVEHASSAAPSEPTIERV